jgi:hypothetical protein
VPVKLSIPGLVSLCLLGFAVWHLAGANPDMMLVTLEIIAAGFAIYATGFWRRHDG